MKITYVPKSCRGENKTFEGNVEINLPSFNQKYDYMEQCNFGVNSEEGSISFSKNQIHTIRKMVEFSKSHYGIVNLKKISDGKIFKSFDEMQYDPDCDAILIDVASSILSGFKVGKN